jgi:hypothetical protein
MVLEPGMSILLSIGTSAMTTKVWLTNYITLHSLAVCEKKNLFTLQNPTDLDEIFWYMDFDQYHQKIII